MLKKSLLANVKAFKVSIGAQTHCTVSSNKAFASPGEIVTISVSYPTGYSNATVSVSPSVTVNKKNSSTYTFVMPSSDVTVTASASVLSFSIYVNKSGSGTVNVKSVANYGERVTVTVSPGQNYELGSISASGVSLSGSGNTRTFTMPANNVTIYVQFNTIPGHIKGTVVDLSTDRGYAYGLSKGVAGSMSRVPMWYSKDGSQLLALFSIHSHAKGTTATYDDPKKEPINFQITILEKGLTVDLQAGFNWVWLLTSSNANVFTKADVGKTFTILFNPAPYSYT